MNFFRFFLVFFLSSKFVLASEQPVILASINPVYQILLAITEDKTNSHLVISTNFSEHNFHLKKSDVELVSKADLIFYVDDDLEKYFPKIIKNYSSESKSFKLSAVSNIKLLRKKNNLKKIDGHIWLNPQNAIIIAEFMARKISEIDQKNSKKYYKNLEKFKKEISKTEKIIRKRISKIKNSDYVFYHDGYQYFENYFGLKPLKIMTRDHGVELAVDDVRELDILAKKHQIKCIFGAAQDEKNSAMKLAQNYKIKFSILDLIGSVEDYGSDSGENFKGYSTLMLNMADDFVDCVS